MFSFRKTNISLIPLLSSMILMLGCNSNIKPQQNPENTLDITVSIPPQEYFVKKIGGEAVRVNTIVEPGVDLHTYEPKPQKLQAVSNADAYITIGTAFEKAWITRLQGINPKLPLIDSGKGIEKIPMVEHEHQHEEEKEENNHQEDTLDPHIWLSPKLAKIQAQNIYDALGQLDPENQEKYQANLNNLLQEIEQTDKQITVNLAGVKNRKFMVFHPAWGYFAKDYNLEQIPIEVGGQEPSAAELAKLISDAKAEKIQVIFAQPEFSTKSAQAIAQEINGEVLLISDLDPNWSDNLIKVSETFAEVLDKKPQK